MNQAQCLAAICTTAVMTASTAFAASITVNTISDLDSLDGFCSVREAILAANTNAAYNECTAGSGNDHIHFGLPLPAAIQLTDHLPPITESLAIHGGGVGEVIFDGNDTYRAITIEFPSGGIDLVLQDLSLINGRTRPGDFGGGGAMIDGGASVLFERVEVRDNASANSGGGIMIGSGIGSESRVKMIECTVSGNTSEGPAGGGGIATTGTGSVLDVVRSAIFDNHAIDSGGGGILGSRGFVTLEASTVSGNSAESNGGGIYSSTAPQGGASLTLRDTTITDNTAGAGGSSGNGGGLMLTPGPDNPLTMEMENTLVAGNFDLAGTSEPDIHCGPNLASIAATGFNLIGANDGCSGFYPIGSPNANNDYAGAVGAEIDPLLGPLADHGGPTLIHRPPVAPISPALDTGLCPGSVVDQRGQGRPGTGQRAADIQIIPNGPGSDGCDIGSFEGATSPIHEGLLFADGFETGNALRWHDEIQE